MIRLLDIPGAPQLQARLELCPELTAHSDSRTRDLLRAVVEVLGFGLDWSGWIELPDRAPGEEPIDLDLYLDRECEEGAVQFWRKRGWDIAGSDGSPVSFFGMIRTAVIVIDEGRRGCSKMKAEAALWRLQRDDGAPADAKAKKQDKSFLELGGRRRGA